MDTPLVIAVSPYHLTTREAPAIAALLLAHRVVTLLPAPASGRTREDVRRAVSRSPRYLRMMESWRWTIPLWHAGVLGAAYEGEDTGATLRSFYERIDGAEEYAGLRSLTRHAAEATPDQFLDLLAGDILKGGPDPGLNIPVSAAIDAFASRHEIVVARASATSVAQRAEAHLGRRAFSVAVPAFTRASSRIVLRVRDELRDELNTLRAALADAAHAAPNAEPLDTPGISVAARSFAAAFGVVRDRLEGRDDDEGIRISTGYVSLTGLVLPADVAMRSGLAAARAMNVRAAAASRVRPAAPPVQDSLVVFVVKQLGFEPDAER